MASTKVKSAVMAVILAASIGAPFVLQHRAQAALRSQNEALADTSTRIVALLQAENERLSGFMARGQVSRKPEDEQFREVLRLRGEAGRLRTALQQLASSTTSKPLSREDALASMRAMYADRVARVKQLFAANPKESVPELRYLTDDQWLELVRYDHHAIDPDNSMLLSSARGISQINFGGNLSQSLVQYIKDNGGQFPTDLTQLTPYFKSPVDDAVLQDWMIVPGNSLLGTLKSDTPWVITQASAVNPALDQRMVIGPNFGRLGSGHDPSQWGSQP